MDHDILSDFTREQRRHLEDVRELWDVWSKLARKRDGLAGAVAWKPVKGRDDPVRYWNDEDVGDKHMTSLGPRSPETEAAKAKFERNRAAVGGSLAQLKERLDALARVGKALRVGRLETTASDVLRQFWRADMLGVDLMVAGSATASRSTTTTAFGSTSSTGARCIPRWPICRTCRRSSAPPWTRC